jgi:radical SAM superfamily enzyme YgiQ (UPF0313 family)
VRCADLAKEKLAAADLRADLIAFYLPMHMATRLAAPVIAAARAHNPASRICAYGVYAPLNAPWLQSLGVDDVLDGEFEDDLAAIARQIAGHRTGSELARASRELPPVSGNGTRSIARLQFLVPDRTGLPPLTRYASLQMGDGSRRTVGYTEASRGCRHLCRHCPIVPVYNGQFRVVPPDVVLADVSAQVAAGAQHITFGDPDFFNGPTHAMRVVDALHHAHPSVTYDVTIKVEHLLRHRDLLPRLRDTGCLFVTSAVESLDDHVLALLQKGHTRSEFFQLVDLMRDASLTLVPTFVAFHPWTTLETYCDFLEAIDRLGLIDHVAPIQLGIRLLVPQGSRMLALDDVRRVLREFDGATLTHRWAHRDAAVDRLHDEVVALVGRGLSTDRRTLFDVVSGLAHDRAGRPRPSSRPVRDRATVPFLNEPWYC